MNARYPGLAAWAGLAIWQVLWHAWIAPPQHSSIPVALALALLPLALPLLAWRDASRMLLVAGMVCLFYFAHGIADAWGMPAVRALALVEIALSLIVIGCVGANSRRRQRGSA